MIDFPYKGLKYKFSTAFHYEVPFRMTVERKIER